MLFNNKINFKKNYLVVYVSSFINKLYKNYEYEVYDELNKVHQEKGSVDESDKLTAIRHFRELIARETIEYVGSEYKEFIPNAEEFIEKLHDRNYADLNNVGPQIDLVYSIVTKLVMGEDYEFRFLEAGEENPAEADNMELEEMIGVMIARLEHVERTVIGTSSDLLVDDGIIQEALTI